MKYIRRLLASCGKPLRNRKPFPLGARLFERPFISDDPYYAWADTRLDELAAQARKAREETR